MKNSSATASLFVTGLLSLCLMGCAGNNRPELVVTKTQTLKLDEPAMVPCERVTDEENADLHYNDDLWQLKERAIKLLDTCADQVDARILRSNTP